MIPKNFLFLVLSFVCFSIGFAQKESAEVHVSYDFNYLKFIKPNIEKRGKALLVIKRSEEFFGWKRSFELAAIRTGRSISEVELMSYNVDPSFLIKKDNQNIIYYEHVGSEIFSYLEEVDFKWDFYDTYKEIKGYMCQKVTTSYGGRNWTGWFAKDLAIPSGPYKFRGTPGLLLEIASNDGDFSFLVSDIYRPEKESNLAPIDFFLDNSLKIIKTTKLDFFRHRAAFDRLIFKDRLRYMNKEKGVDVDFVTIDDSGNEKVFKPKSKVKNYIEIINL